MISLNPRRRLVNFRLSEDEYQLLREACVREGARNLSEYARSAVLDRIEPGRDRAGAGRKLAAVERRVSELEKKVGKLSD